MDLIIIAVIAFLVLLSVCLCCYIFRLKSQIKEIKRELRETRDLSYNKQIRVSLFDKDLSDMTAELNNNLDYQKKLKLRSEEAEKTLKQSVSDIAHDLRTPLTVIKGNLQMLRKQEKLSEKGVSCLDICMEKSDSMKEMADNFFELSVLESDNTPVRTERISAVNLIMQFLADNEAVISGHNLTPEIIFPEKSIFIMCDEVLLTRMLSNLLNNIIKYASESFTLKLSDSGEECVISFSNAVGDESSVDPERLFERIYRGDKARRGSGAGLGLYIVKLLAEKHNAKVKAELTDKKLVISLIFKTAR